MLKVEYKIFQWMTLYFYRYGWDTMLVWNFAVWDNSILITHLQYMLHNIHTRISWEIIHNFFVINTKVFKNHLFTVEYKRNTDTDWVAFKTAESVTNGQTENHTMQVTVMHQGTIQIRYKVNKILSNLSISC